MDTLVLVSRTHEYRAELESDRSLPDSCLDHIRCHGILEDSLHELIGEHGCCIKKLFPLCLCLFHELLRNLLDPLLESIGTCIEIDCLHLNEIDDTLEPVLESDRDLHENSIETKLLDKLILDPVRIGTGSIALVHECDAGYVIPLHLAVNCD